MNEIKEFRKTLDWTRKELAQSLGRAEETLEAYEAEPTPEVMEKLRALAKEHNLDSIFFRSDFTDSGDYQIPPKYRRLHKMLDEVIKLEGEKFIGETLEHCLQAASVRNEPKRKHG